MRIHTLRLRGIGPFRDEQSIDFEDLGRHGVFLLDGPTGVGKSTIVDAVVYALFGLPATEDGQDRMVSDFLGDNIAKSERPFVELTFTASEGTYLIRREPKCPYINRNGNRSEHNATVRLSHMANETAENGTLISTSAQDVGNEVTRLLGLNRGQVLSTIVLAQGQFARFLKARTEDRREILQSVFNTQRYEKLQYALVDARKAAYAQRDEGRRVLGEAIAAFAEASGLQADPTEMTQRYATDAGGQQQVLADRVDELAELQDGLRQQVSRAQAAARHAAAALVAGEQFAARAQAKRKLLARQVALHQEQGRMDALAHELELAQAADVVLPAEQAKAAIEQQWLSACEDLAVLLPSLPAPQQQLSADDLEADVTRAVAERATLSEALIVEASLPAVHRDIAHLSTEIDALQTAQDTVQTRLAALPQEERQAQQDDDVLAELSASLPVAQKEWEIAKAAADLIAQVDSYRDAVVRAKQVSIEASETAHVAEEILLAAQRRYRTGLAAELSRELSEGQACPVCGSVEHPEPAARTQDHVTSDELEELTERWRRRDREAQKALSDLAAKQAALDAAAVRLTCSDPEEVNLACKRAAERMEWAQDAVRERTVVQARLRALAAEREELTGRLLQHREQLADRRQALIGVQQRQAQDALRVEAARAGFPSVASRDAHLASTITALGRAAVARRAEETIKHSLTDATSAFEAVLVRSRFADAAAFRAAVRSQEWITTSAQAVQDHAQDVHAVAEQLTELADVDESVTVDLVGLQDVARQTQRDADEAVGLHAAASKQHERAVITCEAVRMAWQAVAEIERQTAPIIRLANIANGQQGNLHGVKLATYVVKRRFCDVVDAANAHLTDMSCGRYRLEVSDGPAGAERTYGLGLNVYDDRTDAPRGPSTLSGGETFYVSLSLALGLADVVQSESGGITLDTLFVDEGFGSLDSETLDTVMNVLSRLSRGHRTVGLISHVDEMKTRIPDRVEIHRPDPNGPSVIKTRVG